MTHKLALQSSDGFNGMYTPAELSNPDYHAAPGISSSALKRVNQSPLHYKHEYIDGHKKTSAAMNLGTLVHGMVLEDGKLPEDFVVVDAATRNTKIYKETAQQHPDKTLVLASEVETATAVTEAVINHDKAPLFLSGSQNEHSLFWDEGGLLAKCRPDAMRLDINAVGDLKTASDASPDAFTRSVIKFGYDLSAAWYLRGIEAVTGQRPQTWAWIVVETTAPYAVQVYTADQALIDRGSRLCDEALAKLQECTEKNEWPAYSAHILPVMCPTWAA